MVQIIRSKSEFDAVLGGAGGKLVVVDFTASWCGPCRMTAPIFEQLAQKHNNVIFIKVDVDEVPEVSSSYGIRAMPTFVFIKNKQKVSEFSGANPGRLTDEVAKWQ